MFERPSNDSSPIEPGRYVLKLMDLEEMPPSEQHPDWGSSIRWTFHLATYPTANAPSKVIVDEKDKQPYKFWANTSKKLSPKATARPWVETLLGRSLSPDDDPEAIVESLIGKKAVGIIGPNPDGKTRILAMQPYQEPAKAAAAKKSAAVAVLEDDLPSGPESLLTAEDTEPEAF